MKLTFRAWNVYDRQGKLLGWIDCGFQIIASTALSAARMQFNFPVMVGPRLPSKEHQEYLQALKRASDAAYHKQTELIESLYGVDTESRGARHSTPKAH